MPRRLRRLAVLAPLAALAGCMRPPPLPPAATLQSGCHVWYDHRASGRGIAAGVLEYTSVYYGYDDEHAEGPVLAEDGWMWFHGHRFAHFDGRRLVVEELRLAQGRYGAEIPAPPVRWISLEGDSAPALLQVSDACTSREAALGAAAVFVVLSVE